MALEDGRPVMDTLSTLVTETENAIALFAADFQ
jgi:hypothetical protein